MSQQTNPATTYDTVLDLVNKVVKATKSKTDLPEAIADALVDAGVTAFAEDVTVYVGDPKLSATHTVETEQGVVIEYRNDVPLSYRFPANSVMAAIVTAAAVELGRWGIQHTRYDWPQCRFCGRAGQAPNPDCRPATCPACGSRQCGSHHECRVCLVGLIPGWSGSRQQCGYKGCDKPAVAKAPRVKFVCADDLGRATRRWAGRTVSLADDIAERVAIRDGKVRPAYPLHRFVWMPEVAA